MQRLFEACRAAIHCRCDSAAEGHPIRVDTTFAGTSHIVYMVVDQTGHNNTAVRIYHLTVIVIRFRRSNFAISPCNIAFPVSMLSRIINRTVLIKKSMDFPPLFLFLTHMVLSSLLRSLTG